MVKRSLDSMKPAALVAKPLKAFNKETTTGMSAPPMGSTMLMPRKPQSAVLPSKQAVPALLAKVAGLTKSVVSSALPPTARPFSSQRCGRIIGLPGMNSWSFPAATTEPVKVKEPMAMPIEVSNAFIML